MLLNNKKALITGIASNRSIAYGIAKKLSENVEIEANKIALDITKEEKEYLKIKERQLFLFYS